MGKGTRTISFAVIAALVSAACSSDKSASPTTSEAPPGTTPAPVTTAAPATTEAPLAVATFTVQPGTEQVAVLGATAGEHLALRAADGTQVADGTVDTQGSLLFRNVVAGVGYTVRSDSSQS